jgi:hypothetical protein
MTLAVKGIKNHRYNEKSKQFEVHISWKGLDDEDNSTVVESDRANKRPILLAILGADMVT